LDFTGTQLEAVKHYQSAQSASASFVHDGELELAPGNQHIKLLRFEAKPLDGETLTISSGLTFEVEFFNNKENINLDVTFELVNMDEVVVFHHGAILTENKDAQKGVYRVGGTLPPQFLNAGSYRFNLIFGENQRFGLWGKNDVVMFEIANEVLGTNSKILPGVVRPNIAYNINRP
jgi:lipopolysaccharide transport system ATP-binding protein